MADDEEIESNNPESHPAWPAYQDYVRNGNPFYIEGLSFDQWLEARSRILAEMNRYGSN